MAGYATLKWAGFEHESALSQRSAQLEFQVVADTYPQAVAAVGLPLVGSPHPFLPMLSCVSVRVRSVGPRYYEATAQYSSNPGGGAPRDDDPLKAPLRWRWDIGTNSEPFDLDRDQNPIVNSSGDGFDPPISEDVTIIGLEVVRNQPRYDPMQAIQYTPSINSDVFVVGGIGIAKAGQVKCLGIRPTGEYSLSDPFVEVAYQFSIRSDGFQLRIRDQGFRAWAEGSAQGIGGGQVLVEIRDTAGQPVSGPVPLDGRGRPLRREQYRAFFTQGDPSAPILREVSWAGPRPIPKGATLETTPYAVFLRYKPRPPLLAFSRLGLASAGIAS